MNVSQMNEAEREFLINANINKVLKYICEQYNDEMKKVLSDVQKYIVNGKFVQFEKTKEIEDIFAVCSKLFNKKRITASMIESYLKNNDEIRVANLVMKIDRLSGEHITKFMPDENSTLMKNLYLSINNFLKYKETSAFTNRGGSRIDLEKLILILCLQKKTNEELVDKLFSFTEVFMNQIVECFNLIIEVNPINSLNYYKLYKKVCLNIEAKRHYTEVMALKELYFMLSRETNEKNDYIQELFNVITSDIKIKIDKDTDVELKQENIITFLILMKNKDIVDITQFKLNDAKFLFRHQNIIKNGYSFNLRENEHISNQTVNNEELSFELNFKSYILDKLLRNIPLEERVNVINDFAISLLKETAKKAHLSSLGLNTNKTEAEQNVVEDLIKIFQAKALKGILKDNEQLKAKKKL